MTSLLEEEIRSQPEALARLLEQETERVGRIVAEIPEFQYSIIAARGTSDHAATYAKYIWAAMAGRPVALATPSLYTLYEKPPSMKGTLVVGVSQSGQSPDIAAVLEEGRRQGRSTLGITNDGSSPLAEAADWVIELHAGVERSVAATKTYSSQLAVMAMLAARWSGNPTRLDELRRIPDAVASTLETTDPFARQAERYRYMKECVVVGRGYNYATAFELALKLKELTYVMAMAYSSADFRHGPIGLIEEGLPVILILPEGAVFDDMLKLAREARERRAELLIISDSARALRLTRTPLPIVPSFPEWLTPITTIVPGQLFALHLAIAKDYAPDTPRGLTKVTRTR